MNFINGLIGLLVLWSGVVYGGDLGGNEGCGGPCDTLMTGKLVWSDEFGNNGGPDQSKWHVLNVPQSPNNEKQYYKSSGNAACNNGFLTITAKKENFGGKQYTSAKLVSTKEFTYGVFEIKAKLPKGRGTWPAFWLFNNKMGWPDSGEIDVMEYVGFEPDVTHGTIHTKAYYHMIHTQKGAKTRVGGASDGFHTYALDWNSKHIKIYVDGKQYFGFKNDGRNDPKTWPFNHGMPIILNFAVGGDWGGAKGIDDSIFPQNFVIDYVKVYEPNP